VYKSLKVGQAHVTLYMQVTLYTSTLNGLEQMTLKEFRSISYQKTRIAL